MEKDNKLNLMRFWLFGTFVIIMTAATIYVGSVVGTGTAIFSDLGYWIAFIISAFLCLVSYFGYKRYLDQKE